MATPCAAAWLPADRQTSAAISIHALARKCISHRVNRILGKFPCY